MHNIQSYTLTDRAHILLNEMLLSGKKYKKTNPEVTKRVDSFVSQVMQALLDSELNSDLKLVEYLQYVENSSITKIREDLRKLGLRDYEIESLVGKFNSISLQYNNIYSGDRFINQRGWLSTVPIVKSHSNKDPMAFMIIGKKKDGINEGGQALKRILAPGNLTKRINRDGKIIKLVTVGKDNKGPLDSKYFKARMVKYGKQLTKQGLLQKFRQNYHAFYYGDQLLRKHWDKMEGNQVFAQQREFLFYQLVNAMDDTKAYKIRKINDKKGGMEIKLIPGTKSVRDLYVESGRNIDNLLRKVDQKSVVETFVLTYFLGLSDRINDGNTLFDESGKCYPIDYTIGQGTHHNDRVLKSLKGIRLSGDNLFQSDIKKLKDGMMEMLYEEAHQRLYGSAKVTGFNLQEKRNLEIRFQYVEMFKKSLDNISDEDFLQILHNISSSDKISAMQKIYSKHENGPGKDEAGLNGEQLNYNIGQGLQDLSKAMTNARYHEFIFDLDKLTENFQQDTKYLVSRAVFNQHRIKFEKAFNERIAQYVRKDRIDSKFVNHIHDVQKQAIQEGKRIIEYNYGMTQGRF